MEQSTEYSNIQEDYQTVPDSYLQNWGQLFGETSDIDNSYHQDVSQSDTTTDQTTSFGFQQQEDVYQYNQDLSPEEINHDMDYETIVRSKHLYYDPNPQVIRKSATGTPLIYNQNITVRFLQPPPVHQGPLIIREIRPPQPPPPPPLIIRQRAPPPLSPPPIILRERPPPIPAIVAPKVITKTLPPIAPPPRSVIIEKIPPLPAKPRDIIIERWLPYEYTQKRKVIVHRAEEPKAYPSPKNVIITYEPVQTRIIRHFERLGVTSEDPHNYLAAYGNSLVDTDELLAQIRELGITEDLSPPHTFANEQQISLNLDEQNYNYNRSPQQQQKYAATYENLVNDFSLSINYDESNDQQIVHGEDLSTQLAEYGMTTESIPY